MSTSPSAASLPTSQADSLPPGNPAVLVAGGAGYIGSHICAELHHRGFQPVTFDNLSTGHADAVQWGPLEVGDVTVADDLSRAMANYQPVAVIHLAALAYVGESVVQPRAYYRTNVTGSLQLLDAIIDHGTIPVVFSSTCATYGEPATMPIDEDTPQVPINPYGATKLMVERALTDYGEAYGLRSAALRYFNAAGADPDGRLGERHDPETHLIPRVLATAAGELEAIDVFGDDHPTPDGTCVRDYIHVTDLADAHVRALRWLLDGGDSLQLNLGTGNGASVAQVIDTAQEVVGRPIPHRMAPRRAGDPPTLVAAAHRARRTLGWEPGRSGIRQVIEDAWAWHQRSDAGTARGETATG